TEEANLVKGKIENVAPISERLDTLLRNMVDPSTGRADYRVANEYVSSVENFTMINPKAAEAAPLLYKAAEVARSIRLHQRALDIYETICEQYPDYEKAGKAYFMRAFTLDEDLKKPEEARKMYQAFIDKFPNDDFADDAQILLDNIGKSEEEIFQQFEKQRQEQ
ncbi:MAG: tetratricopeptide repeat protein, partial [Bacteroidota bacterium]